MIGEYSFPRGSNRKIRRSLEEGLLHQRQSCSGHHETSPADAESKILRPRFHGFFKLHTANYRGKGLSTAHGLQETPDSRRCPS